MKFFGNNHLILFILGLCSLLSWACFAQQFDLPNNRQVISKSFTPPKKGPIKIAFFDADSTLRVAPSGSPSANFATDVAILPMISEPMKKLVQKGYLIAIVSNQGGIEQKYITFEIANQALAHTIKKLSEQGVIVHYYDFAEGWGDDRKPNPGMAKRLVSIISKNFKREIDWKNTIMVGDSAWKKGLDKEPDGKMGEDFSNSDRLFAENLAKEFKGVKFFHPRKFFDWEKFGVRNFQKHSEVLDFLQKNPHLNVED